MQGSIKQQEQIMVEKSLCLGAKCLFREVPVRVVGCDVIRCCRFIDPPPLLLRE